MTCLFCDCEGGLLLHRVELLRVVLADEPDYPGFCRVILNTHRREMTDLPPSERAHVMDTVFAVERALRMALQPDKINLASLGNQVPHVHWHVIPRYSDDAHFPDPVWAARKRDGRRATTNEDAARLIRAALSQCLLDQSA